jgi:hypothetical protein
MPADSLFGENHEAAIIFMEICTRRNENCKIRAHFGIFFKTFQ